MRQTLRRDIEMLKLLAVAEKKIVAEKYNLTLRGLDSWIYRIRQRNMEARWYINQLLNIEKRNARIRKWLLSSKMTKELESTTPEKVEKIERMGLFEKDEDW